MRLESIRILSDGRPGHENQSVGLAEALRRRCGASVECIRLDMTQSLWARAQQAAALQVDRPSPQLLIAAGHSTHLSLLYATRRFRARSVVIMKPSLPVWCFDLCLVPSHDLPRGTSSRRVVITQGALNRIPEVVTSKTGMGIILVGGPSGHHGWDGDRVLASIDAVVRRQPELRWILTDSRRTPAGFIERIQGLGLTGLSIYPHAQTGAGWLPSQLLEAQQAWVTEDSISMIYEAITAGARTGLIPLPLHKAKSRIGRAVDTIVDAGYAVRFSQWQESEKLASPPAALHEAARCADEVIHRFFDRSIPL